MENDLLDHECIVIVSLCHYSYKYQMFFLSVISRCAILFPASRARTRKRVKSTRNRLRHERKTRYKAIFVE